MPKQTDASQEQAYLAYANRPRRPGASSLFRGVSYRSRTGQWIAQLYWRGRRYFLGAYEDEREAAEVYNKHAQQIIGPFAVLNDLSEAAGSDGSGGLMPEAEGSSALQEPAQRPRARG